MNIFIIGESGVGKTPFAKSITQKYDVQHIQASDWVRNSFRKQSLEESNSDFKNKITEYSKKRLAQNPNVCIEYIVNHFDTTKPAVIEGIRNPRDFSALFNPVQDLIIYLNYTESDFKTSFEHTGVRVIKHITTWMLNNDMILDYQIHTYNYKYFWIKDAINLENSLEQSIQDFIKIINAM